MSDKDGTGRSCSCGFPLESGDNHISCMLCLGSQDMSKCSICKTLNVSAKTLRRRAYNDAKCSGYVLREGVRLTFPPISSPSVSVPQVHSYTTAHVWFVRRFKNH